MKLKMLKPSSSIPAHNSFFRLFQQSFPYLLFCAPVCFSASAEIHRFPNFQSKHRYIEVASARSTRKVAQSPGSSPRAHLGETGPWENSPALFRFAFGYGRVEKTLANVGGLFPITVQGERLPFVQVEVNANAIQNSVSLGIGQRHFLPDRTLGYSLFVDNAFDAFQPRIGVGAEAWFNYLQSAVNVYLGFGNWKDGQGAQKNQTARPASAIEGYVEGYLPQYAAIGGQARVEVYFGDAVELFGTKRLISTPFSGMIGVHYQPVPLARIDGEYRLGSKGNYDASIKLSFKYQMGTPLALQIDPQAVQTRRSLRANRRDFINRNGTIIREYQDNQPIVVTFSKSVDQLPQDTFSLPFEVASRYELAAAPELKEPSGKVTDLKLIPLSSTELNQKFEITGVLPAEEGEYPLTVVVTDNQKNQEEATTTLRASLKAVIADLDATPTSVPADGKTPINLKLALKRPDGTAMKVPVTTSWSTSAGKLSSEEVQTDGNGEAKVQITSDTEATAVVSVTGGTATTRKDPRANEVWDTVQIYFEALGAEGSVAFSQTNFKQLIGSPLDIDATLTMNSGSAIPSDAQLTGTVYRKAENKEEEVAKLEAVSFDTSGKAILKWNGPAENEFGNYIIRTIATFGNRSLHNDLEAICFRKPVFEFLATNDSKDAPSASYKEADFPKHWLVGAELRAVLSGGLEDFPGTSDPTYVWTASTDAVSLDNGIVTLKKHVAGNTELKVSLLGGESTFTLSEPETVLEIRGIGEFNNPDARSYDEALGELGATLTEQKTFASYGDLKRTIKFGNLQKYKAFSELPALDPGAPTKEKLVHSVWLYVQDLKAADVNSVAWNLVNQTSFGGSVVESEDGTYIKKFDLNVNRTALLMYGSVVYGQPDTAMLLNSVDVRSSEPEAAGTEEYPSAAEGKRSAAERRSNEHPAIACPPLKSKAVSSAQKDRERFEEVTAVSAKEMKTIEHPVIACPPLKSKAVSSVQKDRERFEEVTAVSSNEMQVTEELSENAQQAPLASEEPLLIVSPSLPSNTGATSEKDPEKSEEVKSTEESQEGVQQVASPLEVEQEKAEEAEATASEKASPDEVLLETAQEGSGQSEVAPLEASEPVTEISLEEKEEAKETENELVTEAEEVSSAQVV